MRVLLTGAAGNVGQAVCRRLAAGGIDVRATDRRYRADLPVKIDVADLLDRDGCYRLVDGVDAVVHLANHPNAGAADAQQLMSDNVTMNMNLFQAAAEVGVRSIVFASSIQAVSGDRRYRPEGEQLPSGLAYLPMDGGLPPNPGNHYALSKVVTETMLKYFADNRKISAVALRLPMVVLPEHTWLRQHRNGPISPHFVLDEGFTWLGSADCAALVERLVTSPQPGFRIYQPAARRPWHPMPVAELVERFFRGVPLRKPVGEMESLCDISAITRDTGWRPATELE